jgi:GT2 family glycosyltransferase
LKVSVIIVTFNGMEWLPKLLSSIPKKYHIIFVDNNSTDNTVPYLSQQEGDISLFENKQNLGFGAANNLGITKAIERCDDYVFLLNQDAYLIEDPITDLIKVHQMYPKFGILSPIHLDGTEERLDYNFGKYLLDVEDNQLLNDFIIKSTLRQIYSLPFVNAAAWLVSIECISKVGTFDPLFYHYGEDNNYCQRVLYHQYKIGVVPKTYIIHDRSKREITSLTKERKLSQILLKHKIVAADINNEKGIAYLKARMVRLPFVICKRLFTFSFAGMVFRIKEFRELIALFRQVEESRKKNLID